MIPFDGFCNLVGITISRSQFKEHCGREMAMLSEWDEMHEEFINRLPVNKEGSANRPLLWYTEN